jgi:hypothetical protein
MATTNEKIQSIEEQIAQLENRRKELIQKNKADERKARTKRLIERGAILESLIESAESYSNAQIQAFLQATVQTDFARKALARVKAEGGGDDGASMPEGTQGAGE